MSRILILSDGISPFVTGGMQAHSANLAKLFTEQGNRVTLMHCIYDNLEIPTSKEVNSALFGTEPSTQLNEIFGFHFPNSSNFPGHYLRASKVYSQLLLANISATLNSFDFIYAQGFTGWSFINHKKKHPKTPPIFTNLHGLEMYQYAPSLRVKLQHYLLRPITKKIILNSDFNFSFGGKLTDILRSLNLPKNKIIECSHGITSDWLIPSNFIKESTKLKFIFVGRYERRKGIEELSEALTEFIKEQTPQFSFSFIGDIPAEMHINDPCIIYHGRVNDKELLKSLFQNSDVLVCPSYSEGMPTVIFEAMACCLSIISTDVGAVNQQVSSKNGWLLPSPKTKLIKQAMKEAITLSSEKLSEKKQYSRQLVKTHFIWEEVIQKKLRLIKEVLT